MITATDTKKAAAGKIQRQPAPLTATKGTPNGLYTGMVIPIKTENRKEGITMNTNTKNEARILSLDEIKKLPPATVIYRMWISTITEEDITNWEMAPDNLGKKWTSIAPAMICESGDNGYLVGGNEAGTFDSYFANNLDGDLYWDSMPTVEQIHQYGITEEEYNAL